MSKLLGKILCISDTHFGPSEQYLFRGYSPTDQFGKIRGIVQSELENRDVLLHLGDVCGDSSNHAEPQHYRFAGEWLPRFDKPALYIAGNHDRSAGVLSLMPENLFAVRDPAADRADYLFERPQWQILAVDSSDYTRRPGRLTEEQYVWIDECLKKSAKRTVVAIHHPPLPIGCRWFDATMLLSDGERFHELMAKHRDKIAVVLFGHVHDAISLSSDGVQYASIPSTLFSFGTAPDSGDASIAESQPIGFATVDIYPASTRVSYRLL